MTAVEAYEQGKCHRLPTRIAEEHGAMAMDTLYGDYAYWCMRPERAGSAWQPRPCEHEIVNCDEIGGK